jgi:hypothetical protein
MHDDHGASFTQPLKRILMIMMIIIMMARAPALLV